MDKKELTRREFIRKKAKGALALGALSVGISQSCSKSEESSAKKIDLSRISTCSICLNHLPAEEAFPIIAASGYTKVDMHEKVHLQIFPDLCDIENLKKTAENNGLQIANLSTYAGGGLDGRKTAYTFHGWEVPHPAKGSPVSDFPATIQEN